MINFFKNTAFMPYKIFSLIRGVLLFYLLISSLLFCEIKAQVPELADTLARQQLQNISLSTPYHSVLNHLHYLQPNDYDVSQSARSFAHEGTDAAKNREMAVKLKQIWDAEGHVVDLNNIPRNPDYIDTLTGQHTYMPVSRTPGIFLEKQDDGQWIYSRESFLVIEETYDNIFPYGADRLMKLFPHRANISLLGLYLWQYVGILFIIVVGFFLHKLLTFIFNRLLYRSAHRMGYDQIVRPYLLPVARPLSLFMVFVLVLLLYPQLQLPVKVNFYLNIVFKAVLPFFATLVVYKLVDVLSLYLEKIAGKTETNLDNQVVPLIRKILKVFVVVVGILFILQNLDVNITALLAGLSIGGLALALAAQDTLKNLFGSLMIFVDKPFSVGHWITSGEIDGMVEEVGFRSTRVRSFRNSLTYVPNGKLADATIDNHGLRKYRRFYLQIAVTYDTPPDLIQVFVEGLRKIVEEHPKTRKDYYNIEFNDMGDFALKIMFYIFFAVPTWPEELRARHEVLLEIVRLAEKLGVRFAFPTQTLHMETFPDKTSLMPRYDMSMNQFRKVMEDYFEGKRKQ